VGRREGRREGKQVASEANIGKLLKCNNAYASHNQTRTESPKSPTQ